jgi:hypothetical protein
MISESPDTERELTSAPPQRLAGPLLFSVVLHGGLLLSLARAVFAPSAEARLPEERPSVRVSIAMRLPPPIVPEPPPAEVENPALPETNAASLAPEAEPVTAVAETELDEDEETAGAETPTAPRVPTWTPATIRAAIQSNSGARRGTLTEAWVDGCILEQKARGTRDCEEQQEELAHLSASTAVGHAAGAATFAGITRPQRHAVLSAALTKNALLMVDLMEVPGLVGQLATDRYILDGQYFNYLNGNPSPYGPENQFNCAGIGPCIYEYTGFVVERPEPEPEENAFRVVPIVLGGGP